MFTSRTPRRFVAALALAGVVGFAWSSVQAADKPTIKEVMGAAHKADNALLKKVGAGTATKEDNAKLLELYKALASYDPPKGEKASWQEKTSALVKAATALNEGAADGAAQVKAAANCKACHTLHKP